MTPNYRLLISAICISFAVLLGYRVFAPEERDQTTSILSSSALASRDPASAAKNPDDRSTILESLSACQNLYQTVCLKKGITRDPTGSVRPDIDGEREALRLYEDIIQKHPDWTSAQVDEELIKQIYTPRRRARIESAYKWVEYTIERWIDRQPKDVLDPLEKKLLKQRVRKTPLEPPPPADVYADEPELLTKNDVFYERLTDGKTRLRIGGAYFFTSKSWFNLVFTMAHELAHAIDPCELRNLQVSLPAYDRLKACFMKSGLIAARNDRSECGRNDQLSETFADWVAGQITAEALKSFALEFRGQALLDAATNATRDLCEQDDGATESDTEFHPAPEIRIDRIFGRNPTVRKILGCKPPEPGSAEYCTFEKDRK